MDYILSAQGLSKEYGRSKALDDFNIHIPKGAIYGLVGRNGAGKTTLIRLLCGLQSPTAGSFTLYGIPSTSPNLSLARRRMGAVVETPALYMALSAEENLRQQYRVLGLPSFDGLAPLLDLVGLGDVGRKKVRNFSLGMKQRLGLAIALVGDPDFLILDEPTNGLDPQGIIDIRELILRLNRERGITVLISSHILDELSRLATHYGILDRGRMVNELSARELEAACQKRVSLTVSDTQALARVLDAMGLDYRILSHTQGEVYAQVNLSRLALALSKEGCELQAAREKDESLEGYFISLVGGGDHV